MINHWWLALVVVAGFGFVLLLSVTTAEDEKAGDVKTTSSGLKYKELKVGDGETAKKGDVVVVDYIGWLKNGKKFGSSLDSKQPAEFRLGAGRVIQGWEEGIVGIRVGGKRQLIIPAELAYGKEGRGDDIPPDAELTFEVELLQIK
jgi:peptidylprolyl isomerase